MSAIQESYTDLVATMKDLGAALIPATAAQYEAPPRTHVSKESVSESKGIKNPTLDIVMDPRRMGLSDEIAATAAALRQARALLDPHRELLRQAVARWEGQEGTTE